MQNSLFRKGIIFTVVWLFVGLSVVSYTGNKIEGVSDFKRIQIEFDISDGLVTNTHIAYFYGMYENISGIFEFELPDLTDFTYICPSPVSNFPQGGTWTHRFGRSIVLVGTMGEIYILYLQTHETAYIGNAGTGELVDLSYDPYSDTLYGASSQNLYTINMDNGKATLIGPFQQQGYYMISLDFDGEGNMYGIDLGLDTCCFYSINTSTGFATFIGNTSVHVGYTNDLAYDKDNEIMYACIKNYDTLCYELYNINVSTGHGTFIDIFPIDVYYFGMFTIPYNWTNQPPEPPLIDGLISGKVRVEYVYDFSLSDPEDDPMYLRVDWGDGTPVPWAGPFDSDETVRLNHTWHKNGNYTIRAQAKDIYGNESDWATYDIIIDSEAPYIEIKKPQKAIYIRDMKIIPFTVPVIFGDIQIWFSAEDSISGLNRIELFIDDELKEIFTICPKSWLWNETTPWKYKHVIKLIAYDNIGNNVTKRMTVWRFF